MKLPISLDPGATAPTRAHAHDAGLDLYAAEHVTLLPGLVLLIDTGVHVAIPEGHVGLVTMRSSLAKHGLVIPNAPGVIDSGYRGPIGVRMSVLGGGYVVGQGERIAQLVVVPCVLPEVEVVEALPASGDGRGTGGWGSTNQDNP